MKSETDQTTIANITNKIMFKITQHYLTDYVQFSLQQSQNMKYELLMGTLLHLMIGVSSDKTMIV